VFDALGYSPILPLVLQEKGAMTGWSAPSLAGRLLERVDPHAPSHSAPTPPPSDDSESLRGAVAAALRAARIGVVLVVPPGVSPAPVERLADSRLRIVDLREAAIMRDAALRLDGYALSVAGHSRTADMVAPAVVDLIRMSGRVRS
jgi:hypothetical protein